ncbi:hypothetical protein NKI56_21445 [Mesorhizobium sp. M0622]|uniref:hypothetical protein n=1 Tax=unclassified Mesorhizobium TaxID=325217 RepID=UPI00333DF592
MTFDDGSTDRDPRGENNTTIRMAVIRAGLTGADDAKIVAEELPGATLQLVCDTASVD